MLKCCGYVEIMFLLLHIVDQFLEFIRGVRGLPGQIEKAILPNDWNILFTYADCLNNETQELQISVII